MAGIVVLGYGPLVYGVVYYFRDVWTYLTKHETENIQMWQVRTEPIHKPSAKVLLNICASLSRRVCRTVCYGTRSCCSRLKYISFLYTSHGIYNQLGNHVDREK